MLNAFGNIRQFMLIFQNLSGWVHYTKVPFSTIFNVLLLHVNGKKRSLFHLTAPSQSLEKVIVIMSFYIHRSFFTRLMFFGGLCSTETVYTWAYKYFYYRPKSMQTYPFGDWAKGKHSLALNNSVSRVGRKTSPYPSIFAIVKSNSTYSLVYVSKLCTHVSLVQS